MSQPEGRLGAEWIEGGVRFSLFSENAEGVELCLFDPGDHQNETERIPLEREGDIWRVEVVGLEAGPALWISRAWPLCACAGASLQPP